MKIPHPALGKKFCTSGEFRLAKNTEVIESGSSDLEAPLEMTDGPGLYYNQRSAVTVT